MIIIPHYGSKITITSVKIKEEGVFLLKKGKKFLPLSSKLLIALSIFLFSSFLGWIAEGVSFPLTLALGIRAFSFPPSLSFFILNRGSKPQGVLLSHRGIELVESEYHLCFPWNSLDSTSPVTSTKEG